MRDTTMHLRATSARRALIDQAAALLGKSRTEFVLEAASEKAQQVLLDRTLFGVTAERFNRFKALVDAPLENARAVARLLKRRAPWEAK